MIGSLMQLHACMSAYTITHSGSSGHQRFTVVPDKLYLHEDQQQEINSRPGLSLIVPNFHPLGNNAALLAVICLHPNQIVLALAFRSGT